MAERERVSKLRHIWATFIVMVEMGAGKNCWVAFPLCTSGKKKKTWSNISPEMWSIKTPLGILFLKSVLAEGLWLRFTGNLQQLQPLDFVGLFGTILKEHVLPLASDWLFTFMVFSPMPRTVCYSMDVILGMLILTNHSVINKILCGTDMTFLFYVEADSFFLWKLVLSKWQAATSRFDL